MNARGFTLIEIIVTIVLMAIMGFMAAQLIATTLRGSAESARQVSDLAGATSVMEECIAFLNTETMQKKTAGELADDTAFKAFLKEKQASSATWKPDNCEAYNLLITVKRGSVELSRAF